MKILLTGARSMATLDLARHLHQAGHTILVADREPIQAVLTEAGIASAIYYPIPVHHQEFFRQYAVGKSLPVSEQVSTQVLSLPIYPELTCEQIDRVVQVVGSALMKKA